MSGHASGLMASLLRSAASIAQWPYRAVVAFKNWTFDGKWRKPFDSGVPVISVGNLTTGGTGKTPIVAFLANWFRDANVKVGLLSRGYKSLDAQANDEKLVLDQLCSGVPHWLNPDRIVSAKEGVKAGCELLILDDAFQHRRIHRDLDILLIDATNPWGYGHCLPRGLCREPVSAIERADLVLITRADLVSANELITIRSKLAQHNQVATVIEVAFRPTRLLSASGNSMSLDDFLTTNPCCIAACGIGNPEAFRTSLRKLKVAIAQFVTFPDHHHFTADDLARLADSARDNQATAVLVTQKDLVKLRSIGHDQIAIWAVQIGIEILRGADVFESFLFQILEQRLKQI